MSKFLNDFYKKQFTCMIQNLKIRIFFYFTSTVTYALRCLLFISMSLMLLGIKTINTKNSLLNILR